MLCLLFKITFKNVQISTYTYILVNTKDYTQDCLKKATSRARLPRKADREQETCVGQRKG